MNKQSADLYALALAMELARTSDTGFSNAISNAAADYAKNLSGFIAALSASLQAEIHEHVDLNQVHKLIKNSSGQ